MSNGTAQPQPQPQGAGTGWIWLLALGAVGVGAYMYGRRTGLDEGDANLELLAEQMGEAQAEAENERTSKVRDAALETSKLTARLAELAQRKTA